MRLKVPALAALPLVVLAACGSDDPSVTAAQRDTPVVVTALRPLAEAIDEVAGDAVVVVDLVPIGEPSHDLALTDRQADEVRDADLAVVLGRGFQPDLEAVAAERSGPTLDVLATLALPDRADGEAGPPDPHVWLDPTIMGSIVTAIADAVAGVVPDRADDVRARAERIVEQHVRLDAQLAQGLATCRLSVIASQHESFGWFAARYGLRTVGLDGPHPDDDLTAEPAREREVVRLIDEGAVTTLFAGTLVPGVGVEALADREDLPVAVLNPYEGLTPGEAADGATYRSILLYDLRTLQDHLECEVT